MVPDSILDVFNDPQMRHAALVHLPVALSMLALLAAFVSACCLGRQRTIRWTTVTLYALLVLSAVVASRSGEDAEHEVGDVPPLVHDAVHEHERLAERVWIFAAVSGVLVAGSSLRPRGLGAASAWLAVLAGAGSAGWTGVTAHHGGELVYVYGVGTPDAVIDEPADGDGAATYDDPRAAFFVEHVRPILADSCMGCHNPSRKKRSGDLDQTSIAGLLRGGVTGPAIVPGRPEESLMITAVRGDDDWRMPPKEDRWLTADQIETLEQWILDGAVWVD